MRELNKIKNHLQPVPRELANIEAEKGETVLTNYAGDGIPELYTIDGHRHANGGSPIDVPDNSFIYSDYVKMKIKDESILDDFMISNKRKGYTPASISKKYALNKYKEILLNPESSKIEKNTAEMMIKNNMLKLGELALVQEAEKGFEDGVPTVAIPYLNSLGIESNELVNGPQEKALDNNEEVNIEQSRLGKQISRRNLSTYRKGGLVKAQSGKQYSDSDVDNYDFFKTSRYRLNRDNSSSTKDLGVYGPKLIQLREFFISHPEELDKFYNTWKEGEVGKSNQYNIKDKNEFIDEYINWLYTKQSWLNSGEGGHDNNYWSEVSPWSNSGKQRRNTKEYSDAFEKYSGLSSDYIKAFQSMDLAMNDYAKSDTGKKYGFTTNDFNEEDDASNAGYSNTTDKSDRKGVSITDGKFGKRTADFLPFISEPVDDNNKTTTTTNTDMDLDHVNGTHMTYDDRWNKPDRLTLLNSLRDRLSIERAKPWLQDTEYADIDPHYVTHKTDATNVASNAATIMNAAGMNADSSQDVLLATALNNNANDADINLQSNEQVTNTGIANQYEQANAQNLNNEFINEAANRKKYYDETQIGKQNYENAIRQANAEVLNQGIHGWTNRNMRENAKWTYADGLYGIDPETGYVVSEDENFYPMDPQAKAEEDAKYWDYIETYMDKYKLDASTAIQRANEVFKKSDDKSMNNGLAALAQLQGIV